MTHGCKLINISAWSVKAAIYFWNLVVLPA